VHSRARKWPNRFALSGAWSGSAVGLWPRVSVQGRAAESEGSVSHGSQRAGCEQEESGGAGGGGGERAGKVSRSGGARRTRGGIAGVAGVVGGLLSRNPLSGAEGVGSFPRSGLAVAASAVDVDGGG